MPTAYLYLYLIWAAIIGGIFIIGVLLVTMTPLSRLIGRPLPKATPVADDFEDDISLR